MAPPKKSTGSRKSRKSPSPAPRKSPASRRSPAPRKSPTPPANATTTGRITRSQTKELGTTLSEAFETPPDKRRRRTRASRSPSVTLPEPSQRTKGAPAPAQDQVISQEKQAKEEKFDEEIKGQDETAGGTEENIEGQLKEEATIEEMSPAAVEEFHRFIDAKDRPTSDDATYSAEPINTVLDHENAPSADADAIHVPILPVMEHHYRTELSTILEVTETTDITIHQEQGTARAGEDIVMEEENVEVVSEGAIPTDNGEGISHLPSSPPLNASTEARAALPSHEAPVDGSNILPVTPVRLAPDGSDDVYVPSGRVLSRTPESIGGDAMDIDSSNFAATNSVATQTLPSVADVGTQTEGFGGLPVRQGLAALPAVERRVAPSWSTALNALIRQYLPCLARRRNQGGARRGGRGCVRPNARVLPNTREFERHLAQQVALINVELLATANIPSIYDISPEHREKYLLKKIKEQVDRLRTQQGRIDEITREVGRLQKFKEKAEAAAAKPRPVTAEDRHRAEMVAKQVRRYVASCSAKGLMPVHLWYWQEGKPVNVDGEIEVFRHLGDHFAGPAEVWDRMPEFMREKFLKVVHPEQPHKEAEEPAGGRAELEPAQTTTPPAPPAPPAPSVPSVPANLDAATDEQPQEPADAAVAEAATPPAAPSTPRRLLGSLGRLLQTASPFRMWTTPRTPPPAAAAAPTAAASQPSTPMPAPWDHQDEQVEPPATVSGAPVDHHRTGNVGLAGAATQPAMPSMARPLSKAPSRFSFIQIPRSKLASSSNLNKIRRPSRFKDRQLRRSEPKKVPFFAQGVSRIRRIDEDAELEYDETTSLGEKRKQVGSTFQVPGSSPSDYASSSPTPAKRQKVSGDNVFSNDLWTRIGVPEVANRPLPAELSGVDAATSTTKPSGVAPSQPSTPMPQPPFPTQPSAHVPQSAPAYSQPSTPVHSQPAPAAQSSGQPFPQPHTSTVQAGGAFPAQPSRRSFGRTFAFPDFSDSDISSDDVSDPQRKRSFDDDLEDDGSEERAAKRAKTSTPSIFTNAPQWNLQPPPTPTPAQAQLPPPRSALASPSKGKDSPSKPKGNVTFSSEPTIVCSDVQGPCQPPPSTSAAFGTPSQPTMSALQQQSYDRKISEVQKYAATRPSPLRQSSGIGLVSSPNPSTGALSVSDSTLLPAAASGSSSTSTFAASEFAALSVFSVLPPGLAAAVASSTVLISSSHPNSSAEVVSSTLSPATTTDENAFKATNVFDSARSAPNDPVLSLAPVPLSIPSSGSSTQPHSTNTSVSSTSQAQPPVQQLSSFSHDQQVLHEPLSEAEWVDNGASSVSHTMFSSDAKIQIFLLSDNKAFDFAKKNLIEALSESHIFASHPRDHCLALNANVKTAVNAATWT